MKAYFDIHPEAYKVMLDGINNLMLTERCAPPDDLAFIKDNLWLSDSAVIEHIYPLKGQWEVRLLFAHVYNPLQFLCRRIHAYACPRKAATHAGYMRRVAAKDQRGTLAVKIETLKLPPN